MQENNANEDLPNFPFKNWSEFKKANDDGSASLGIDRGTALSWTQKGVYVSKGLHLHVALLMLLPFLSTLGFIIYLILTKSWFLLPALILFFISIFIFTPSSRFVLGGLPNLIVGVIFAGFVWSIFKDISWLVVLTSCLLLIWYGITQQYKKSVAGLKKALLNHEDLFILFWNIKGINIALEDEIYWVDKSIENTDEISPVIDEIENASPALKDELYLNKEQQEYRRIALIHCEDEECGFGLEFTYPNCTYFYCPGHNKAINIDLESEDPNKVGCKVHGKSERYDLILGDNICPRCKECTLAILSVPR